MDIEDKVKDLKHALIKEFEARMGTGLSMDPGWVANTVIKQAGADVEEALAPIAVDKDLVRQCRNLNRKVASAAVSRDSEASEADKEKLSSTYVEMDQAIRSARMNSKSIGYLLELSMSQDDTYREFDEVAEEFVGAAEFRLKSKTGGSMNAALEKQANRTGKVALATHTGETCHAAIKEAVASCKQYIQSTRQAVTAPSLG